ncbi:MAG: hypothetical protein EOO68_39925 [Moraxellaceae bacterium]|nr:MAG: hypothetical protein EOO68_39925 [Moraxellaceae bacterium]
MSLPVTVKEFTMAKLLVNIPVFTVFWLVITAVAFYFSFGFGVFPYGTIPFITMIFLGIYVAYVGILSAGLICQSYGITIIVMLGFELGTPAYLWIVAFLEPINHHVYDANMVWNSTAVGIVTTQIITAVALLVATWYIQTKKRDFI